MYRNKNTLPINKAKWELTLVCIIIWANYIIIIIRANSRFYSSKYECFLSTPEIYFYQIDGTEHWSHTTPNGELVSMLEDKCHTLC